MISRVCGYILQGDPKYQALGSTIERSYTRHFPACHYKAKHSWQWTLQFDANASMLGGSGLIDPSQQASSCYENLESITRPLVNVIPDQARECSPDVIKVQMNVKNYLLNLIRQLDRAHASQIIDKLPPNLQRSIEYVLRMKHQHDSLPYHCLTMDSPCIKVPFVMPCVWDMDGNCH